MAQGDKSAKTSAVFSRRQPQSSLEAPLCNVPGSEQASRRAKDYPFATFWSLLLSFSSWATSYCPSIIQLMFGIPEFQHDFGAEYQGQFLVSAARQTALSTMPLVGIAIACATVSAPLGRFGFKYTSAGALVLLAGFTLMQIFASSFPVLLVACFVVGTAAGALSVLNICYAAEMGLFVPGDPLSSANSLAILAGQLLAGGVGQAIASSPLRAYRIGYAVQLVWPLVILPCLIFAPERPVWLALNGRSEAAYKAMRSLARSDVDSRPSLAAAIESTQRQGAMFQATSIVQCFGRTNRRRTVIAIVCSSALPLSGIFFGSAYSYIMIISDIVTTDAFAANLGFQAAALISNVVSLLLRINHKRWAWICSLIASTILMLLVAVLDFIQSHVEQVIWSQAALLVLWFIIYGAFIGPLSMIYMSQIASVATRERTISAAFSVQSVWNLIATIAMPYLYNSDAAMLGGKIGFIFAGTSILVALWSFFELPELRTVKEMDVLFDLDVKAADFAAYSVEHFESGQGL